MTRKGRLPRYQLERVMARKAAILAAALGLSACGVNADDAIYPLYVALTPIGAPAIVSVQAVEIQAIGQPLQYGFDLQYYLTNQESGFVGYNLYINNTATSAQAILGGVSGQPYLPSGVRPSFNHADQPPDTTNRITQRLNYFKAPPSPEYFATCERYYFRMSAYTREGLESIAGAEISACAAANVALCPSGTPCNP
ncbi:MAG: hypothetical protein K1X75_16775 [Leptospirales bacterium]|nr:hypothetical protein [Leptospirales bacterium]